MKVEWSVRSCTEDDIPQVYELARISFDVPVTFSYEHIAWLFLKNPAGHFRGSVAHIGDRIVGFYGVIPVQLYFQGRKISASQSLLTMTHPDYRRQGMFMVLASALYRQLAEDGVAITYGFPNENSLPGFISKLDWAYVETLSVYVRPLNASAIISGITASRLAASVAGAALSLIMPRVSSPRANGFRLQQVKCFDNRLDDLVEARRYRHAIQQVRSSDFLNWRYADCPDWDYRLVIAEDGERVLGYAVLRCLSEFGLRGGMIMDILALPGRVDVLLALVRDAVFFSAQSGMDLTACLIHGDSDVARALRRSWFFRIPKNLGPKKWHFGARLNDGQLPNDVVNNPNNWFLTFGDNDPM